MIRVLSSLCTPGGMVPNEPKLAALSGNVNAWGSFRGDQHRPKRYTGVIATKFDLQRMSADFVEEVQLKLIEPVDHLAPFSVDRPPGAVVRIGLRLALRAKIERRSCRRRRQ